MGALSKQRLCRLTEHLLGCVDRREVAGIVALVARRDHVHVDILGAADLESGTPMRRDTIFRVASMTKPVAAAAAMMLVEEARLRLDEPVDRWLPELADRQVLRRIDSDLTDTVPAGRPITLRDLLTFRLGLGAIMAMPGTYPIQRAMDEAGVSPGPQPLQHTPDEFMRRLGGLPLAYQPGERWMYHLGSEILGVLIERVAGMPLSDFLRDRLFAPLGMDDTGFTVPEASLDRLASCYRRDPNGKLVLWDPGRGGLWSRTRPFPSAGGGLASTADDFLAFGRMMLRMGRFGRHRLLARPTVELMTMDHVTPEQKAASFFGPGFWDATGWGFGMSVVTRRDAIDMTPGRYGWHGGYGTTFMVDPREEMITVFLMQRMMNAPDDSGINNDFLTLAYQAIDD